MTRPHVIFLPQVAVDFLAAPEGRHGKAAVRLFHGWMERKNRWLESLTRVDVDLFLANPAEKPILATTRNGYRYILFRYLDWLRARELISFDSAWLRVRRQELPESAEHFLESLRPTLKPATCGHYRQCLRLLHNWLAENDIAIQDAEPRADVAVAPVPPRRTRSVAAHPSERDRRGAGLPAGAE